MGDLRDQLLKAGLVSEEAAAKADRDRRQQRQKQSRQQRAEVAEAQLAPPPQRTAREQADVDARLLVVAEQHRLRESTRGNRRWYFVRRDDRVDYLEVNEGLGDRLERGDVGLAEGPDGRLWFVDASGMGQIAKEDPAWIACWNRRR